MNKNRFTLKSVSTFARFTTALGILAMLAASLIGMPAAYAISQHPDATLVPQRPSDDFVVYLPFVGKPGTAEPPTTMTPKPPTPVPPTPTPQPAQRNGFFVSDKYLSYNAASVVDKQGGVHLAFYYSDEKQQDKLGQPAFYTYCPGPASACTDTGKWSSLVQFSSGVNEVQIVATTDGRPRLLIRRNGNTGYDYEFYACESQCTDGAKWTGLLVTRAAGVELFNADQPQHSFALDAQDRPRFVYSNGWGNSKTNDIYYTYCDAADCTEPGSWQEASMWGPATNYTVGAEHSTLVFDGAKPRVLTRYTKSGLGVMVYYFQCDAECEHRYNWNFTRVEYPNDKLWTSWDLALDAQGNPRLAMFEPPNAGIQVGGKLYYGWCDVGCLSRNETFKMVQITDGEGKNVDLEINSKGHLHMVYDAGQRGPLAESWCESNCEVPSNWQRRILETSDKLQQELAPVSPFTCNQDERLWTDTIPTIGFDAQDKLVVAYDTKNVTYCYYTDPANPNDPPKQRVERLWWAVRWAYFN